MPDIACSIEEFQTLVQPLIGLVVSRPWKGYGSAIFFELGEVTSVSSPSGRRSRNVGEAGISVEWDWRVEDRTTVLYGSSNSRPKILSGILSLQGTTIEKLSVVGQVPELVVHFSNGHRLCSMIMVSGNPDWHVKLSDGRYVYAKDGHLFVGVGGYGATEQEIAALDLAERTAARWGSPDTEPTDGSCANCASFVYLDGDGPLLDYGACFADGGPFDARVVNRSGGCLSFSRREET
jgi:hypothetical protein